MEELAERLSMTEVQFAFGSMPDTDEARAWMMELDFVDIHEGSIEDLEELARTAPTREAAAWLYGFIHHRKMMRDLAGWPPARPQPDAAAAEVEQQRQADEVQHREQQQTTAAPAPKKKPRRRAPEM